MSASILIVDRTRFIAGLEAMIRESLEHAEHAGLLLVDLSNLLAVNHQHGYAIGDRILQETVDQLSALSKRKDNVYRISSKTFALLMPRIGNVAFIALAVNRVQHTLTEALFIDDDMLPVELRFGLSLNPDASAPALSMLARAEVSLARSRQGAPLDFAELTAEVPPPIGDLVMGQRFAEALHNNDFELYFQPKLDLHTGKVSGAEALIRWQLPGRGYVPPEELVGLAHASGQSYELTRWVVNRALRYQR
ncbi:MAG: EAL domain-containing protein, partial [Chromatocurvus sp.]